MQKIHTPLSKLILSVCILAPVTIDIFISGLPAISHYFYGKDASLLLSIALLGLAIAQPIYGPLLDRFGRKPILLGGLIIYTLASNVVMMSNSFEYLLVARFLQTIGACSTTIAALAIARDTYDAEELIKATSLIMLMMSFSPIVAPLIGSILNSAWNWRSSFVFLFILGLSYSLLILFSFKETLTNKNLQALQFKKIFSNYFQLTKTPKFLLYCTVSGLAYCMLFSYLSLSSRFLIEQMSFSLIHYGWIVAFNAIAFILMAKLAPQLVSKLGLPKTISLGFLFLFSGGISMFLLNANSEINLYNFAIPMFFASMGAGLVRPTASASAMKLAPSSLAGSASAIFNFVTFTFGAIASHFSTQFIHSVFVFGLLISLLGSVALFLLSLSFGRSIQTI